MMPPRVFFCHIPKTGGTSLRRAIERQYWRWETLPDDYMMARNGGHYPTPRQVLRVAQEHPDKIRLIRGHYHLTMAPLLGEGAKTVVVVRHPLPRAISHLEHAVRLHGADACEIERTLAAGVYPLPSNLMSRFLLGSLDLTDGIDEAHQELMSRPLVDDESTRAALLRALDACDYVGVTEDLGALALTMSRELFGARLRVRRKNTTPYRKLVLPPGAEELILRHSQLDLVLYESAKRRQRAPTQSLLQRVAVRWARARQASRDRRAQRL
jgi:hypothetical protein